MSIVSTETMSQKVDKNSVETTLEEVVVIVLSV